MTTETRRVRDDRQFKLLQWAVSAFGSNANSRSWRTARFLEEALELVQALGAAREDVHRLVDYVYDRPAGEPFQEAGGVAISLLALLESIGISADQAEKSEMDRVLAKPIAHFRERQSAKDAAGFAGLRIDPNLSEGA